MRLESQNKLEIFLKILLFIVLVYFPIFIHLETLPIRVWDEARLAINSYEMNKNGNYLIPYFEGQPDMWNTKPPLMIWLQVFFMKLLGPGVLAVRLPSAIAAFFTTVVLVIFSLKYLKNYWFGLIASLVLITSYGYIHTHATRTGDYDALLTLFTSIYALSFFLFLEHDNKKYLHLFFISIVLSVLTKSVQGLMILPALFIYMIVMRKLIILKNKWFYIDLMLCIIAIGSYYLTREHYNPGYLKAVWLNELGGRYLETLDEHKAPFMFYYNLLVEQHYIYWYFFVPCGIAIGIFAKNERFRRLTIFSTLLVTTYWLIISLAKTKMEQYELPLFPFLSLIVAVMIYYIFNYLKDELVANKYLNFNIIPYVFIFIIVLSPYQKIIGKVYCPKESEVEEGYYQFSHFLQDAVKSRHSIKNYCVCFQDYNAHLLFYVNILNDRNQNITFKHSKNLLSGDLVVASQDGVKEYIENNYIFETTGNYKSVKKYKILGEKQKN